MKFTGRTNWLTIVITAFALLLYFSTSRTYARGGGGHGGGHEGGHEHEHHEEHHAEHHEEHHEGQHHHEGEHVAHDDHHHDDHHWNHHHHDWHDGGWGWGPGFWGGAVAGYGLGAWSGWGAPAAGYYAGGDTYVDNSNSGNITEDSADAVPQSSIDGNATDGNLADNNQIDNNIDNQSNQTGAATAQSDGKPSRLPVDAWPELGVSTFSGHNGDQRGLVVVRVKPDSIAQRAGLVPGDVILKLNGEPTPNDESLENLLESTHGTFDLSIVDANTGEPRTVTADLGETKPNS